ncbi:extracellular solute-binding protein [Paenibacillus pasadenensis]|uniref:extracellular solute-binding protein n=1 Tax=Paenibacillus pasadenensis TaxID=217090 RepID=UPI00203A76E9|nr:extracellular solute-binding protein [Paenibacillus pasadenensis]MCM3747854.1 extracellular solute-binding protein [Paenibacillus pasadenensis]
MNRTKKKWIASMAVVPLLAGVIAGCSGGNNGEGAANTPAANNSGGSDKPAAPVELSIFRWDFEGVDAPDSAIYKRLQEKLNIKLKPIVASWNDWEEKLNVMIASGEMPDVFVSNGIGKPIQYKQWVKEGLLLNLSDEASKYPNIGKSLANFEVLAKSTEGKHYGLPIFNESGSGKNSINGHNILIRKDWLDKLGLKVPTTIDEFYAVAKAFTENDPDGNGKKDTYGYTSSSGGVWWQYPIFNAFDASTGRFQKTADGKFEPEVISPGMEQSVAFLNKMYGEKLLDPDFMLNTDEQKVEKFITGKVGMIVNNLNATFYTDITNKFQKAYADKDPKSIFTWVGTLKGANGKQRMDGSSNFWLQTSINAGISDEKKQKALELLDYLLSEEGQDLMLNGIEGVHYKLEGDKKVPIMTPEEKDKDFAFKLRTLVSWNTDFLPESTPNRDQILTAAKSTGDYAVPDPLEFLNISEDALDPAMVGELGDYVNQQIVDMIVKSKDVPADFAKFKEEWLKKGGTKLVEETNKQAAAEGR